MKNAIKRNFLKFTGRLGFNRGQINNNVPDEPEIIGLDLPKEDVPTEIIEFERDEFHQRTHRFRAYLASLAISSINNSKNDISFSNNNSKQTTTVNTPPLITNVNNNNNNITNSNSNSSINLTNIYLPNELIHAIFCTLISNSNMLIDTSHLTTNNNHNRFTLNHNEYQSNCSILAKAIPIMSGLTCAYISCTSTTTPEELVQQLFLQIPLDNGINNKAKKTNNVIHNNSFSNLEQSASSKPASSIVDTPSLSRSRSESFGSNSSLSPNSRHRQIEPTYKMVDILLVDDIDIAPLPTRYTLLQMMTYRKVAFKGFTYNTPSSLTIIATASHNQHSLAIEPLSPLMLDCFFINIRLYEHLKLPPIKLETDPLISTPETHYIVTPSRLQNLRKILLPKIYITHDIEQYMRTIIVNLRNHPMVTFGPSPRATPTLTLAAKIVAMLSGQKFVTPTHILTIAAQVLNHRIFLSNPFPLDQQHNNENGHHDEPFQSSPSTSPGNSTPAIQINESTSSTNHDPFTSSGTIPISSKIHKPMLSILSQATQTLLPPPPISIVDTSGSNDINIKSSVELHQMKRSYQSNQEMERDFDSFGVIKIILENLSPPL